MFSQDGYVERGQQGGQKPETGIFSNNFGGLNKVASPLNVPFEDSPDLLNVDVDVSGNVNKRKGTRTVFWNKAPGTVQGVSSIPFTTGLGYNLIVLKNNTAINLLEVINDNTSVVMTKNNIFTAETAFSRVNYVSTNEIEPRLIITSGFNPPVQLKFVEQQYDVTVAGSSITIPSADRFINASTSNLLVFKNRVRQTGFSVSYAGNNLTLNGLTVEVNDTIDVILVCWQWWAEAYYYLGERFSSTSTRTNSAATIDKVVSIPASVRDDMSLTLDRPTHYPIQVYKNTDFASSYTPAYGNNPSDRVSYAFTDGTPYNGQGVTTPSPLFVTFGGTADTATSCDSGGSVQNAGAAACPSAMPVVYSRKRMMSFNGGAGIINSQAAVYVDGTLRPLSTNMAAAVGTGQGASWYSITNGRYLRISTTNTVMGGIEFASASQIGLPSSSMVEVVNPVVQNLGSGGNSNRGDSGISLNTDGSWIPAYGFGDFCNYATGSFPTNVAIYQGRLVFSGFLNNSLRVVFSNQYDSVLPGRYFAHYQIDSTTTAATDAFDITLSSAPDDVTKGLMEWQQSLFLLTRKAVFRIYGGSNSAITNTNRIVVLVSNVGLINSYSVCRTDKSILYLSDTGVFDLSTSIDSSEYIAGEKSLKVRTVFGIASDPAYEGLPWLSFDSTNKVVYLGYPNEGFTSYCSRLFVYNTFRESWTEYYTPGNFNTYAGMTYTDRQKGLFFGFMCNTYRNEVTGAAQDLLLVRTGYWRYLDYAQETIGTGELQNIEIQTTQRRITTTVNNVHHYGIARSDTLNVYGVRMMPMLDVQDVYVQLETGVGTGVYNQLKFNTEWKKLPSGKIYLIDNPGTGRTLRIFARLPVVDSEVGLQLYLGANSTTNIPNTMVYVDNVFKPQFGNFTFNNGGIFGSAGRRVSITAPLNSVIVTGEAYPCYYCAPMLTQEHLGTMKRAKYVLAFFDNRDGMDTFSVKDLNVASGQASTDLIGFNKQRLNANISIRYEADDFTSTVYDNYGYNDLIWDDTLFDVNAPNNSYRRHVLFKEALQGVSYSYQLIIWNYDETTFTFAGYQIMANIRGTKHINWTR